MTRPADLLDLPPFPAEGYARLADRIGRLLLTRNDVLIVQGEAIVALEATATSLARPGLSALNIVTSPYGTLFGRWLERGGAEVATLAAAPGRPVTADAVRAAWGKESHDLVALVHAESASGILNPLEEIAALAKARGALMVVDAVASVGGHALDVDALGIDIAVIGPQKALGGSTGLSALCIGAAAWDAVLRPDAPRDSILSLADHKTLWLDKGRGALPGMPSALEAWAFDAALARIEEEGIANTIARHHRAQRAAQAALAPLGLTPLATGHEASALVTPALVPEGLSATQIVRAAGDSGLSPGVGEIAETLLRLNHTGPRAAQAPLVSMVSALGGALRALGMDADVKAACDAVAQIYADH